MCARMFNLVKCYLLISSFLLFQLTEWGINSKSKVSRVLKTVYNDDQRTRSLKHSDLKNMNTLDKINLIKIKSIINKYNWPLDTFISKEESRAIFLTIQHSELKVQKYHLPLMVKAVELEKLKESSVGLLEDRIAIQEGRPQIYGTQIRQDMQTGEYSVFPICCPDLVDERRKKIGLAPLSEYVKLWNIKY